MNITATKTERRSCDHKRFTKAGTLATFIDSISRYGYMFYPKGPTQLIQTLNMVGC